MVNIAKRTIPRLWPLDLPIVRLGASPWTLEDALTGLLVMGATGSGKSSGPAALFSRKLLELGLGGIVLCYKREEAGVWVKRMKDAGRESDTCVFGLDSPYRFNFLDFESEQKSSGLNQIDNLANMLLNIASVRRTSPVGNEASWFLPQKKLLIRSSLSLLLLAEVPLTLKAISRVLQSAPSTLDESRNKEWQKNSYLFALLLEAEKKHPDHPELQEVKDYWLAIRPAIGEKNRGPIDAEYTGMVSGPLSRGQVAELFASETNIDPTACFDGKVIIIDLPVEEYEEARQYAALIWSVAFMRACGRRDYNAPGDRPVFLFADEAQAFSTDHDANFFATCRSKGVCNVRMTQNLAGYIKSYGGGGPGALNGQSDLGEFVYENLSPKRRLRDQRLGVQTDRQRHDL
jgi:hypothetical protein